MRRTRCILTCEHITNFVPVPYRTLFRGHREVLRSHRGWDLGVDVIAQVFQKQLHQSAVKARVSRLLIELNRSLDHPQIFSEFTDRLSDRQRERLIATYYLPYRERVEGLVRAAVTGGERVVHLSLHTFTPHLHGEERRTDVGLLYDPRRRWERELCDRWKTRLERESLPLRIRRNYPYRGSSDGLTTTLRHHFSSRDYAGIELEVNQKWSAAGPIWRQLAELLAMTFVETCR